MAKQPETPFNFDVTKIISDFKLPGVDVETLVASQRRNIEALTQANKLAFEGVQAVFKRQAEIIRQAVEESAAAAKAMGDMGSPQDKAIHQTEIAKEAFERAVANARELSEIMIKSNNEACDLLNKRFSAVLDEVKDSLSRSKSV